MGYLGNQPAAGLIGGGNVQDGSITNADLAAGVAVANLGYTPVNKAGDTMTGALTQSGGYGTLGGFNAGGQNTPNAYGVAFSTNVTNGGAEADIWNPTDPAIYTNTGILLTQRLTATTRRDLMFLHHSGYVTTPSQPSFHAYCGSGTTTSVASASQIIIPLSATKSNIGNCFNTTTYLFTAPVNGNYFFSGATSYSGTFGAPRCITYLFKNGSQDLGFNIQTSRASNGLDTGGVAAGVIYLYAGDTMQLRAYQDSGSTQTLLGNGNSGWTYFTGCLLG